MPSRHKSKTAAPGRLPTRGKKKTAARTNDDATHFIDRELSWLAFNTRVLAEAERSETPLLERLVFLAIVSSNLDEFFMVRVGGLRQKLLHDEYASGAVGPQQQLAAIAQNAHAMVERQYRCLMLEVLPALARHGIVIQPHPLNTETLAKRDRLFDDEIFPTLTPIAVEPGEDPPHVAGLVLHLAVLLGRRGETPATGKKLAIVPLSRALRRLYEVPGTAGFVLVEDIVRPRLDRLFEGYEILESAAFRMTRDADLGVDDEDVSDALEAMEGVLRARRAAAPVRLEIEDFASLELTSRLCTLFDLDPGRDLYRIAGPLDLKPLMAWVSRFDNKELRYPKFEPQMPPDFEDALSLWDVIRDRDVLVHLPYESFDPVVDLLNQAADDPQVLAIKQVLYRTSSDSPIVAALERAARNEKQVTVLVELKARFDEARNIGWARRLTEAGAQVIYGVVGLKTHAKVLLIVRSEADGIRRYVHLATGNYNDVTARRYEDLALFTCHGEFATDASTFFNAVTGYSEPSTWSQFAIAPTGLRKRLSELIDREIARSSRENPGFIMLKMNSFADTDLAAHLYRASQQGVRIRLCVRGICCLRPGVPGVSDNIDVVSIVDRFLEHSRVFYFRNGGQEEVYLSSADFMPRNLDRRLELMFPLRDPRQTRRAIHILETLFADNQRAWRLRSDGTYEPVAARNKPALRAQAYFAAATTLAAESSRRRRLSVFQPVGPGMAPGAERQK